MRTNGTPIVALLAFVAITSALPGAAGRMLRFDDASDAPPQSLNSATYRDLKAKTEAFHGWLEMNKGNGGEVLKSSDLLPEFDKRNAEIDTLNKAWEKENAVLAAQFRTEQARKGFSAAPYPTIDDRRPHDRTNHGTGFKSVADGYAEAIKADLSTRNIKASDLTTREGCQFRIEVPGTSYAEMKAVMTNAGTPGTPRFRQRIGRVEALPVPTPMLIDMIPMIPTDNGAMEYLYEVSQNNNAGPVAENAARLDSDFTLATRTITLQYLGHIMKVTREQLADVDQMAALIENRGMDMLYRAIETQLLNGNGAAPNLLGIFNTPGVLTQAKGTDPTPDAFYKAMQKIRTIGYAEPDTIAMHNDDWTDIRLLRTADGIYIFGDPSQAGPERLWGKTVVQNPMMTANTGIVGAFNTYAGIYVKGGLEVDTANQNEDDFRFNRLATRIQRRMALAIFRPSAFSYVTGI